MVKLTQQNKLEGAEARHQAYEDLSPSYRKALVHLLMSRMIWFSAIQKDRIYKSMRKTATDLMD